MPQCSILIVDDEVSNFDVIEAILSGDDYQLHYVDSGQEAIDSLHLFQPDLILLDIAMPGMNGLEVCQRIRATPQWQPVPIIVVTALAAKESLTQCLEAGANDFISKPINSTELRARVHSMLRIKQQYDDLQTLLKFREDMVHMLVHDLRNRLTEVLLGLEFLKSTDDFVDKYELGQIYASVQTLQVLVDDLLKIALIESGKVRLNLTQADPTELIRATTSNFAAISTQKSQSLICQIPEVAQRNIALDVTMMSRVLDNLLSNAIKFSPQNSEIIVKLEPVEADNFQIQVIDSGPGVPDGVKQEIFEKYETGMSIPNVPQIGLGLAFAKMVVEAHAGQIRVKDNHPQGAIFEIILPGQLKADK